MSTLIGTPFARANAFADNDDFISLKFDDEPSPAAASPPAAAAPSRAASPTQSVQAGGPWVGDYSRFGDNALLRLHQEILDFCLFVSPTPDEEEARTDLVYENNVEYEIDTYRDFDFFVTFL
jgi:hypothetical protein